MSLFVAAMGLMGLTFSKFGAGRKATASSPGTPTGDGTMDFSIATGDDTGLLALLEDI
jgi:hypothetical protein